MITDIRKGNNNLLQESHKITIMQNMVWVIMTDRFVCALSAVHIEAFEFN